MVALYRIFVDSKAFLHLSIIRLLPSPPPALLTISQYLLLHGYCAICDPHPTPLVYAIHHTILAVAISCKGQGSGVGLEKDGEAFLILISEPRALLLGLGLTPSVTWHPSPSVG